MSLWLDSLIFLLEINMPLNLDSYMSTDAKNYIYWYIAKVDYISLGQFCYSRYISPLKKCCKFHPIITRHRFSELGLSGDILRLIII